MRSFVSTLVALVAVGSLAAGCKHKSTDAKPPAPTPTSPTEKPKDAKLSPEDRAKALAKIDDGVITLGEFEDRLMRQSPYIRHRYASRERKKQFLDNMIRFELMAKEAMAKGYDKDPDVVRTMKQVMIQKLIRNDFEKKLNPKDIPEAELKTYYEKHQREYNTPEQVRASHVLLKFPPGATAAQKETTKARAKAVLAEVRKSGTTSKGFADLARKYSEDTGSKRIGGDLRYFSRTQEGGTMVKEFSDAAFALKKVGDVSGLVQTRYGYHIIRLSDRRPARNRSFDMVKRQIQNRVYRQKRTKMFDDFVKSLRAKAKVEVNDGLLDLVKISAAPAGMGRRPRMPFMHGRGRGRMPRLRVTPSKR